MSYILGQEVFFWAIFNQACTKVSTCPTCQVNLNPIRNSVLVVFLVVQKLFLPSVVIQILKENNFNKEMSLNH